MFTGIIEKMGTVEGALRNGRGLHVRVKKPAGWKLALGESVNIDGVCSTVKKIAPGAFEVEYMPETLSRTTVGMFKKSAAVNLERALRAGDRLGGHIVQGHVDATGTVRETRKDGNAIRLTIGMPREIRKFVAMKGSVAVSGVSLTVASRAADVFTVSLVRYTLDHTNLRDLRKGDKVNLEVDVIARYLDVLKK